MDMEIQYCPVWRRYLEMFRDAEVSKLYVGYLFWAMMEYRFENKEPENLPKALRPIWILIRKDLDDARRHYETSVKNGRKGGRPKKKPENNPEETQTNLQKGTSTTTSTSTTTTMTTSSTIDTGSAPADAAGALVY